MKDLQKNMIIIFCNVPKIFAYSRLYQCERQTKHTLNIFLFSIEAASKAGNKSFLYDDGTKKEGKLRKTTFCFSDYLYGVKCFNSFMILLVICQSVLFLICSENVQKY